MVVCPTTGIKDWYTIFDYYATYTEVIHCNTSAVYPRSTIVYLLLFYSVVTLLVGRIPVFLAFCEKEAVSLIYGPVYFIPALVLTHFVFGGVICELFLSLSLSQALFSFTWTSLAEQ